MKKMSVKTMVTAAVLIAAAIVLSRFLSINAWNLKIGFTFVPVFLAAWFYGPWVAAMVGGVADFVGAILFPIGPYFPGFTLTCALSGVIFGLLLHKNQKPWRVVLATAINQLILGLLVNTFWISIVYGSPYLPLLGTRVIQCLVMMPVEYVTIVALAKVLGSRRSAFL